MSPHGRRHAGAGDPSPPAGPALEPPYLARVRVSAAGFEREIEDLGFAMPRLWLDASGEAIDMPTLRGARPGQAAAQVFLENALAELRDLPTEEDSVRAAEKACSGLSFPRLGSSEGACAIASAVRDAALLLLNQGASAETRVAALRILEQESDGLRAGQRGAQLDALPMISLEVEDELTSPHAGAVGAACAFLLMSVAALAARRRALCSWAGAGVWIDLADDCDADLYVLRAFTCDVPALLSAPHLAPSLPDHHDQWLVDDEGWGRLERDLIALRRDALSFHLPIGAVPVRLPPWRGAGEVRVIELGRGIKVSLAAPPPGLDSVLALIRSPYGSFLSEFLAGEMQPLPAYALGPERNELIAYALSDCIGIAFAG